MCGCGTWEWCNGGCSCGCDHDTPRGMRRQGEFFAEQHRLYREAGGKSFQMGYAAGLDAAREAVAALEPLLDVEKGMGGYDCCGCATVGYLWTDALAAIDALRGEPNE